MTTIQTDAHISTQQNIVENFYQVLMDDLFEAEQVLEALDEDTSVDANTYMACRALYDQEVESDAFWQRENYLTAINKHN